MEQIKALKAELSLLDNKKVELEAPPIEGIETVDGEDPDVEEV